MERAFLTGATGFVGGHLLKTLLLRTNATVTCLVRAPDEATARRRLEAMLATSQASPELIEASRSRVEPVLGDVASPRLGLRDWERVARETDVVWHVAGNTSLLGTFDELRGPNVDGAANVIELALASPGRRLVHVSTFTVMGDLRFGDHEPFREDELDRGQRFPQLGYEQTKFEAERAVHAASDRGLRWVILRLGQIFGDSVTGAYPIGRSEFTGVFYDVLRTAIECGVTLNSPAWFDITPIDYASEASVRLGVTAAPGTTWHLVNPDLKRYSEVMRMLAECGYPVALRDPDAFVADVRAGRIRVGGQPYRSRTMLLLRRKPALLASESSTYASATKTREALAGLPCPPIDRRLLETYLGFCRSTGFLRH